MQAAASEVGIDPALVARAARLLPASASSSRFERLVGGPLRHDADIHLPVRLDEASAARLLAAVQLSAGQPGTGHSSPIGMVWHASGEGESFNVTATPEEGGTSVAVRLDRRPVLAVVQVASLIGFFGATTAGIAIGSQVAPELGAAAALSGMGGIVVLARWYWASSTRRVREQVSGMMEAIGRAVDRSEGRPST